MSYHRYHAGAFVRCTFYRYAALSDKATSSNPSIVWLVSDDTDAMPVDQVVFESSLLQDELAHSLHEIVGTAYGQPNVSLRLDVKAPAIDSHL